MLPRIQILIALVDHLRAAAAASPSPFLVRHERHRESSIEERPVIAVKFLSDDVTGVTTGTDDGGPSMSETVMEISVDLICDVDLPPEADPGQDDPDPTGLGGMCGPIETCLNALFVDGEEPDTLGGILWDIRYEGSGNDDDSSPDEGRMVERLVLVYRVRADDPTYLLTGN